MGFRNTLVGYWATLVGYLALMSVTMIVRMTVIITNSAHQDDDKRYNPDEITVIPLPSDEDDDSVPLVHPVPVAPHDEVPAVLALG